MLESREVYGFNRLLGLGSEVLSLNLANLQRFMGKLHGGFSGVYSIISQDTWTSI